MTVSLEQANAAGGPGADDGVAPELETRLRAGDQTALSELFNACRPRLLGIIEFRLDHRLRARLDAEDVLQDAYLAARSRLGHYADSNYRSPFLWLRAVLTQTLIDLYRRQVGAQRRDPSVEFSLDAASPASASSSSLAFHLVGTATTPGAAAIRADLMATVTAGMARLEPADQEILGLRHFEELSNGEVAELLGIQPKAASIRYVRALRRLRLVLAEITSSFQLPLS